jgi:hypothetical protein
MKQFHTSISQQTVSADIRSRQSPVGHHDVTELLMGRRERRRKRKQEGTWREVVPLPFLLHMTRRRLQKHGEPADGCGKEHLG